MHQSEFFLFLLLMAEEGIRCSLAVLTAEVRSVSGLGISGSIHSQEENRAKPNHQRTETQCSDIFALEALVGRQRLSAQLEL